MIKKIFEKCRLFSTLYGKTLSLFFSHSIKFLCISLFFILPLFLIDEFLYFYIEPLKNLNLYSFLDGCLYVFSLIVFILYGFVLQNSMIVADRDKALNIRKAFKQGGDCLVPYFFVQILYLVKVVLWGLLLVVPGIISIFVFSFSGFALLLDGKKGGEALRFSKKLVVEQMDYYFDMLILFCIFQGALMTPFYLLINQAHRFLYVSSHYFLSLCVDFLIVVLVVISLVIMQIFFYYLYNELKEKG